VTLPGHAGAVQSGSGHRRTARNRPHMAARQSFKDRSTTGKVTFMQPKGRALKNDCSKLPSGVERESHSFHTRSPGVGTGAHFDRILARILPFKTVTRYHISILKSAQNQHRKAWELALACVGLALASPAAQITPDAKIRCTCRRVRVFSWLIN
jgi:hypothetical protein